MKRPILFSAFLLLLMFSPLVSLAQTAPFPDSGGGPPCDGPFGPVCPIDGGLSLLIAAGVAYGGKKAFDVYRNEE